MIPIEGNVIKAVCNKNVGEIKRICFCQVSKIVEWKMFHDKYFFEHRSILVGKKIYCCIYFKRIFEFKIQGYHEFLKNHFEKEDFFM